MVVVMCSYLLVLYGWWVGELVEVVVKVVVSVV